MKLTQFLIEQKENFRDEYNLHELRMPNIGDAVKGAALLGGAYIGSHVPGLAPDLMHTAGELTKQIGMMAADHIEPIVNLSAAAYGAKKGSEWFSRIFSRRDDY